MAVARKTTRLWSRYCESKADIVQATEGHCESSALFYFYLLQ